MLEVRYSNVMNNVSFSGFKEKELDLFFSICFKLKEYGTNELILDFEELKELSNYQHRGLQRFYKDLDQVYKKLLELNFRYEDEEKITRFVLFNRYDVEKKKKVVSIKINEDFKYILNGLTEMYTKFDLLDFVNLKSVYSKNTFKLLKQWETTKKVEFEIDIFRDLLGVPTTYNTDNFNKRVLKPLVEELQHCFKNLKLEKIRTGRKITKLKFTWESKKREIEKSEIELEITQSLNSFFEKAKKNRFLTEILTEKNIYKLTQMYEEDQLKKGLLYIYKQVKKDIPNFSYLIKILETGIQEQEIKIKVINDEAPEEIEQNIEEKQQEEEKKDKEAENPLLIAYYNFPESIKNGILESAKDLYLKDVNIKKMDNAHEKFFKAAEKQYILRVLGGEK
ncbi:MAG: replication initiation protein [Cetobacterium sp.]